jgi:hypothetical protein
MAGRISLKEISSAQLPFGQVSTGNLKKTDPLPAPLLEPLKQNFYLWMDLHFLGKIIKYEAGFLFEVFDQIGPKIKKSKNGNLMLVLFNQHLVILDFG